MKTTDVLFVLLFSTCSKPCPFAPVQKQTRSSRSSASPDLTRKHVSRRDHTSARPFSNTLISLIMTPHRGHSELRSWREKVPALHLRLIELLCRGVSCLELDRRTRRSNNNLNRNLYRPQENGLARELLVRWRRAVGRGLLGRRREIDGWFHLDRRLMCD